MGIFNLFKNLNRQPSADPKLPAFHKLSSDTYGAFIERNEFVVILFYAVWDVGGAKAIRPLLRSVVKIYGDQIQFGEVDIDENQDIASSIQIMSIPAIGYYRNGKLIGLFKGQTQDLSLRITALLAGKNVT